MGLIITTVRRSVFFVENLPVNECHELIKTIKVQN